MSEDSFDVPVTVMLPIAMWKRLGRAAQKHETSVATLVVECVRRQIVTPPPTPPVVPDYMRPRGMFWTDQDDAVLRRLHAEGKSDGAIAKVIGVKQPTVSTHRRALGLPTVFDFPGKRAGTA